MAQPLYFTLELDEIDGVPFTESEMKILRRRWEDEAFEWGQEMQKEIRDLRKRIESAEKFIEEHSVV